MNILFDTSITVVTTEQQTATVTNSVPLTLGIVFICLAIIIMVMIRDGKKENA